MTWEYDRQWREEALALANGVLLRSHFVRTGDRWRGPIAGFTCEVDLSDSFPFSLPVIRVDRELHPQVFAHVDAKGTICFADSTNILIDARNPDGLVQEALQLAATILDAGPAKPNEIASEFSAYWDADTRLCSLCTFNGSFQEIVVAKRRGKRPWYLAADTRDDLAKWLANRGMEPSNDVLRGYVVPLLVAPISLLDIREIRFRHVCRTIRTLLVPSERPLLTAALRKGALPAVVIPTFPVEGSPQLGAFGFIARPPQSTRGFRPGKIRGTNLARLALPEVVEKLGVRRADPDYLLPRGGACTRTRNLRILVIGAGAVGGWVCQLLSSSGVGRLGIVDNDVFSLENVHRHVLGMEALGHNKAEFLAGHLRKQFPHQDFWARSEDCIRVLSEIDFAAEALDLVILATGNETLERRVSRAIRDCVRLAHVWLDPFDLGLHVFLGRHNGSGCFGCLFGTDDVTGLHNRASFLDKGQRVTRTMAGCSGHFAPYSIQHALSAASILTEAVVNGDIMRGPLLISKFCSDKWATEQGFRTSPRRRLFGAGQIERTEDFNGYCCGECSQ